jgi:predicted ATPase
VIARIRQNRRCQGRQHPPGLLRRLAGFYRLVLGPPPAVLASAGTESASDSRVSYKLIVLDLASLIVLARSERKTRVHMSIRIASLKIADPATQMQITQGIEAVSSEFSGEWLLSLLDSPSNESWQIKLTGPDGIQRVRMLTGPYQHSVHTVQKTLRELRYPPSAKEKVDIAVANLREQGHTVDPRIHTDGKMWFEIDRRMLASWQEMQDLADGLLLEELEAIYIKRREKEQTAQNQRKSASVARGVNLTPIVPFLTSLRLDGFLSFPPGSKAVKLMPLNVIIGPNGSGKSNFIEALELIHATPTAFASAISDGGGAAEWIWKGDQAKDIASIEALINGVSAPGGIPNLRYRLSFTASGHRTEVTDEAIEELEKRRPSETDVFFYYRFQGGHPVISVREITNVNEVTGEAGKDTWIKRYLQRQDLPADESVLSQRRDRDLYPELAWLGHQFESIQMFRDWSFGRYAQLRQSQSSELPADALLSDSKNLSLVLNELEHTDAGPEFNKLLSRFLPRFQRFSTRVHGSTVQFYLHEQGLRAPVPATRLSDGTIRFMAILALLLSPKPKPLVCIEEPELGLHPDALPLLANLMVEASKRTQLVVTTHSDSLISALTEQTDSVLVCEDHVGTTLHRLESAKLRYWLDRYRLGEIWRIGEIGGNP